MKKETGEKIYELKYTGHLMNADSLYLHYGYENWSDVSEKKMRKLKSCYKIEVAVPEGNELNFCFRANENEWDNNCGNNYWFNPMSWVGHENVEITSKVAAEPKATAKKTTAKATTKTATKTTTTKTATAKKKTTATKTTKK